MVLVCLAASITFAIVGIGTPEARSDRQPVEPSEGLIQVISASHEVRFPEEVALTLEAEGTFPIAEVALFYRLADQDTKIFGYPDFEPDRRVTANFTLRTGGSSYIPSGVEIEYYYRIVDENGTAVETETRIIEYRDPAFEWKELQSRDLVVVWHDISAERVQAVTDDVSQRLEAVKSLLGLDSVSTMKAVIINGRREALEAFPLVSGAARRGHLYGGFAFGQYGLFVLAGLGEEGMVHEATHLLLHQAVDSPLARVPAWLNEGLAMYFEAESHGREAIVAGAVRDKSLLRLAAMNAVPGRPEDVRLFYAQSWSLVRHIVDTHGEERMAALLRAVNGGSSIDQAASEVYGMSLQQIESEWRTGLAGTTMLAPRPDPGTVGTTLIISGALLVAFVLSALRWRPRRRTAAEPEEPEP